MTTKEMIISNTEEFLHKLLKWAQDNQDNDKVSDNLYKSVHKITIEVIDQLDELED